MGIASDMGIVSETIHCIGHIRHRHTYVRMVDGGSSISLIRMYNYL